MSLLDRMRLREADDRLAVQRWKDANGYDDLITAYAESARNLTTARARIAALESLRNPAADLLEWADSWLPDEANDQGAREVRNELRRVLKEVSRG